MMNRNLRILVATDLSDISHSVKPEFQMFQHWSSWGHEVTVFTPKSKDRNRIESSGISIIESQQIKKICRRTIRQLHDILKKNSFDIVYATNSKTIPSAAFAALKTNVKLVAYRGTTSGLYWYDPTSYLTVLHPRVDAIACVSNAVKERVLKAVRLDNDKVVAIHKGQDLSWYDQPAVSLSQFGIPDDAFVVIAVANFRPKKGLSVLIEAAKVFSDIKNIHLLIVGSGADKEPYASAIKSNPMRDRIHCIGFHDKAPTLIAASDVLVQASISGEGLPRTVVESLAYGVPVISSDAGGAKEIIDEGKSGFIVPANDPIKIAEKVRYLNANAELIDIMSEACRNVIQEKLSTEGTAKKYISFFEKLIS